MQELPPLPTLPITSKETLRKCRELSVGEKDLFICSFPKSGTTWMQNIVFQILCCERSMQQQQQPNQNDLPLDHISQYAPFYEIDPHWQESSDQLIPKIQSAHDALGYRLFNTHLRWDMLPQGVGAKYIYVCRDGRDCLTSFYHHLANQHPDDGGFQGDFETFFHQFLDGTIAYGKWSHHLASWMPQCLCQDQILLVRYEDLKKNIRQQVGRIAEFLELDNVLKGGSTALDGVLERVSFEWMREHQELFHPISVRWKPGYNFIRNGSIGDHGSLFDEQHRKVFVEAVEADFGGKDKAPKWLYMTSVFIHDELIS